MEPLHANIKALGETKTRYSYDKPDNTLLERFPSPFALNEMNPCGATGVLDIVCPEFTSLCPKSGQPDFATIKIQYAPDQWCVESKSLKLYLGSFRNHGEFHESCVNRIINDLVELLDPQMINVTGEFSARGGIPFWPTAYWEKSNFTPPEFEKPVPDESGDDNYKVADELECPNKVIVIAALRIVNDLERGNDVNKRNKLTPDEITDLYEKHPHMGRYVTLAKKFEYYGYHSVMSAMWYIIASQDSRAHGFFVSVRDGEGLYKKSPEYKLRKILLNHANGKCVLTRSEMIDATFREWAKCK